MPPRGGANRNDSGTSLSNTDVRPLTLGGSGTGQVVILARGGGSLIDGVTGAGTPGVVGGPRLGFEELAQLIPGVQAGVAAGMRVLGYGASMDARGLADAGAQVFADMRDLPDLLARVPKRVGE